MFFSKEDFLSTWRNSVAGLYWAKGGRRGGECVFSMYKDRQGVFIAPSNKLYLALSCLARSVLQGFLVQFYRPAHSKSFIASDILAYSEWGATFKFLTAFGGRDFHNAGIFSQLLNSALGRESSLLGPLVKMEESGEKRVISISEHPYHISRKTGGHGRASRMGSSNNFCIKTSLASSLTRSSNDDVIPNVTTEADQPVTHSSLAAISEVVKVIVDPLWCQWQRVWLARLNNNKNSVSSWWRWSGILCYWKQVLKSIMYFVIPS